jgi:hypothetical protein
MQPRVRPIAWGADRAIRIGTGQPAAQNKKNLLAELSVASMIVRDA